MYLEDEGRFVEAEAQFVAAGRPREAIDMCAAPCLAALHCTALTVLCVWFEGEGALHAVRSAGVALSA
jgi:hypothetical protein